MQGDGSVSGLNLGAELEVAGAAADDSQSKPPTEAWLKDA